MGSEDPAATAPSNRELIERLYQALDRHDGEAMAARYAPDARFSDPVFTSLHGGEVGDMWRMLCSRATDLSVDAGEIEADELQGGAHWVATYTFGATGRQVRNDVRARFRFRDGLIADHVDEFGLWRWAGMALGPAGRLLGWSPPMRAAIRRRAARQLEEFRADRAEG
jgi:ketosteroid isomerase-like protein